jgi:hypothetical protein
MCVEGRTLRQFYSGRALKILWLNERVRGTRSRARIGGYHRQMYALG